MMACYNDPEKTHELWDLAEKWEALFGESLPMGYPTGTDDIPMLRRCIEAGDPTEYNDYVQKLIDNMKPGEVW